MKKLLAMLAAIGVAACGEATASTGHSAITACADAIQTFDAGAVRKACNALSRDDQDKAARLATEKDGVIVFLPPYKAAAARAESPQRATQKTFDELRGLALRGDYQAQRDLAYGYSNSPYPGQSLNPILACAWRTVIILSGSERVDLSDVSNHKMYCGSLDQTARAASEAQAVELLKRIQ